MFFVDCGLEFKISYSIFVCLIFSALFFLLPYTKSYTYGERIGSSGNRNIEAPFVKTIEKIMLLEDCINQEIDRLVDLKVEIGEAINKLEKPAESLLLKYRYLDGMEWIDILQALAVSYRTVHRIHASALKNFSVPENR